MMTTSAINTKAYLRQNAPRLAAKSGEASLKAPAIPVRDQVVRRI